MTKYCLLNFAYCKMCSAFREFLSVINDTYLNNQCRVKNAEFLISTFSFSKNNNNNNSNNFIYTSKIDQLNLNIKTAGINPCAVVKPFQISVAIKKLLKTKR